jgi:hypothetical protein
MKLREIIHSSQGRIIISIVLGLGLATLFRATCNKKGCVVFSKPSDKKIDGKTFQYGNKCYQYSLKNKECNSEKKTVRFR